MKNIMEYKTIDNTIVKAVTKENKINDLLTEKANNLIESLPIEKGSKAIDYINYLKNNNIDFKDGKNKFVLATRVHIVKYGSFETDAIAKAVELEKVSSIKELELKYFNRLLDLLKEQKETTEESTPLKMDLQTLATNKKELRPITYKVEEVEPIKEEFYNTSEIKEEEKMQKEYIKKFNSMKSEQEKENIKNVVDKFIANEEITKEEYNNLIKYYKGTCLIDFLKYDTYKAAKYTHMNEQEQKLHSIILRSCFILNY